MKKLRISAVLAAALMMFALLSGCMFDNMTAKPKPETDESSENSDVEESERKDETPGYTVVPSEEIQPQDETEDDETEDEPEEDLPEPEPEPDPFAERADEIIAGMTGDELIYQMFVISPEQLTGVKTVTAAGETSRAAVEKYPVAGLCYRKDNIVSRDQVIKMTTGIQSYAKYGLILCLDEEGGRVRRLTDVTDVTINPMFEYRELGKETAFQNALTMGTYIKELGFNADLAPVADVWYNSENTVIGDRAYSDDFGQAAELVGSAVEGFKSSGIITTIKHFPGHGGTVEDSHEKLATLDKSLDQLMAEEFLPFSAGIEAGTDMVMVGHILLPQVDSENVTTFSSIIVTDILRDMLGFDGVIITDSMAMEAVNGTGSGEAAVKAIKAGVDLILEPQDFTAAVQGVSDAIGSGELSYDRLIESVRRVLILKLRSGIIE